MNNKREPKKRSNKNIVWKDNFEIDLVKQDSLTAMRHHAHEQINKLQEHADLLVDQAKEIIERVKLAEKIATAEYGFKPVHLKEYYLYQKNDKLTLTLIAPDEWISPYGKFIATVRQLGDSTWEKVENGRFSDNRESNKSTK